MWDDGWMNGWLFKKVLKKVGGGGGRGESRNFVIWTIAKAEKKGVWRQEVVVL